MKRIYTTLAFFFCLTAVFAQKLHLDFSDKPLWEVLAQIDEQSEDIHIHYIMDEVAPFRFNGSFDYERAVDAVRIVIADLPFSLIEDGQNIFVNLKANLRL